MAHLTGETIGRYQVVEHLGRGGMADVYRAFHLDLEVYRALKVIRPEFAAETGFRERFQREARAVAALRHPNIVQMHDFGTRDDLHYMVMEYIEGQNLKQYLVRHAPVRPFTAALPLVEQIASALAYAHERGLIHRDIKPANVMLTPSEQVILTDFGIARMIGSQERLTQSGTGIGTPAYMAPEQAEGRSDLGPAVDIYSLGVILYEMLTGHLPFTADTPLAVLLKVISDPVPLPQRFSPDIPNALQGVILKALSRNPAERYPTATALGRAFRLSLETGGKGEATASPPPARGVEPPAEEVVLPAEAVEPVAVAPEAAGAPPAAARPTSPWLVAGLVVMALLLGSAAAAVYFLSRPAPPLAAWHFVVDASTGMGESLGGRTRMEIARAALAQELDILPPNVSAGLRTFGGGTSDAPCRETELLLAPAVGQAERLAGAMAEVAPGGEAPLTEAIVQAIGDLELDREQRNSLIVITAGLDSCQENGAAQLETLSRRLGIDFELHLIGLGVDEAEVRQQLELMALAAGGRYYDADDEGDIRQVLAQEAAALLGTPAAAPTDAPSPTAVAAEPFNASSNAGRSDSPLLAFDGRGGLYLVWEDNSLRAPQSDILYRRRAPDGTWSETESVTADVGTLIDLVGLQRHPEGAVCVFWYGNISQGSGLYQSCLGEAAEEPVLLATAASSRFAPAFASDGTAQTLVGRGRGSLTMGDVELGDGEVELVAPSLAVDRAGGIHAAWVRQSASFSLQYRFSGDGGATWSPPQSLSDEGSRPNGIWTVLLPDELGNVHLLWGWGQLFYRRWTPGEEWGPLVELTQGEELTTSTTTGMAVDARGLAYVVWQGYGGLYLAEQQPDGRWSRPQRLLEAPGGGPGPAIAVDGEGGRHIAWQVEGEESADILYLYLP